MLTRREKEADKIQKKKKKEMKGLCEDPAWETFESGGCGKPAKVFDPGLCPLSWR